MDPSGLDESSPEPKGRPDEVEEGTVVAVIQQQQPDVVGLPDLPAAGVAVEEERYDGAADGDHAAMGDGNSCQGDPCYQAAAMTMILDSSFTTEGSSSMDRTAGSAGGVASLEDERQCWVCFASDEDDPTAVWTHPCRSAGSPV